MAPTVADGWGADVLQPNGGQPSGGAGVDGTQVLFLGDDAWQMPGGPDGRAQANRYGYQEAQRRRRLWLIGGISAGTAVAIAIIVVVASSMGGSPSTTAADQTRVTTPPSPTTAVGVADRGRVADRLGHAARLGALRRAVGPVLHASSPLPGRRAARATWTPRSPGPRASPRSPGRSTAGRPPGTARRARARCRPSTTTPARPTWRTPRPTSRRPSATRTTPRSPTPRRRC